VDKESQKIAISPDASREKEDAIERDLRGLRQWRLRTEGAIESSGHILREWDTARDESLYCGAMESILGIYPHEMAGTFETWANLIHPDDRPGYRREIQRVLTEGGPFQIEYRAKRRNGQYTQLLERGYFISQMQGASPVLSSMITDVSEIREIESRLRQAQRVEAFSQLTGGVAHDFNNMLSVVIGYTQILLEDAGSDGENSAFLAEIEKAALRASSLTNQLLAFTKPATVRRGTVQPNDILNDVAKMLRRLLGEQIALELDPGENIWAVQADRAQIEQALINLAAAARESMPSGGTLVISTSNKAVQKALLLGHESLSAGSYVLIRMMLESESGRAMSKAFEKKRGVASAVSTVEKNEGVLAVLPADDGKIQIDLYLPSATEPSAPAKKTALRTTAKTARILLVEDDSALRQFAKTVLARLGHTVIEAVDGENALEILTDKSVPNPDLVITDIVMPRLGGIELAKRIAKFHPEIPILLATGYPDQQAVAESTAPQFELLRKPFAVGELISKVGSLLEA
jgi:PAS domain S-box-containing protein